MCRRLTHTFQLDSRADFHEKVIGNQSMSGATTERIDAVSNIQESIGVVNDDHAHRGVLSRLHGAAIAVEKGRIEFDVRETWMVFRRVAGIEKRRICRANENEAESEVENKRESEVYNERSNETESETI